MRTIWKGSLSFGLINIPVQVCGAVEANQVAFHQLHKECKSKIKYQKYCPVCDKEVPAEEIIKGYETTAGMITVTEDDLAGVALGSLKNVELAGFIKEKEVDALYYQKPYYLHPDRQGDQAYWILYHALKKSSKVAIARFAVHSREHLALVRPAKGILTLSTLYYPEEIREVEGVATPIKPDAKFLDMALGLIEQQTIQFEPEVYKDRYREALEKLLEKKQPEVVEMPVQVDAGTGKVMDLMEALKASIEETKKRSA